MGDECLGNFCAAVHIFDPHKSTASRISTTTILNPNLLSTLEVHTALFVEKSNMLYEILAA